MGVHCLLRCINLQTKDSAITYITDFPHDININNRGIVICGSRKQVGWQFSLEPIMFSAIEIPVQLLETHIVNEKSSCLMEL